MRSLSIIAVLQTHIDQLITKTRMQLLGCKSLTEVEKCVELWKESLNRILTYDDLEKSSYIHPMIHKLCEMMAKFYAADTQPCAKNMRNVTKNLKVLGGILTVFQSGSLAPGLEGVGQDIAARLRRTSSVYKQQ